MPMTISRAAPLVMGPAPVTPPLRLADRARATSVEPPVGTVTGLARPVERVAAPEVPASDVAPPPAMRRAVRPAPPEAVHLVDAVDEYVGEPRVPAEPYRAPSWLRFMPTVADQDPLGLPGLPPLPRETAPAARPAPAVPAAPSAPELVVAEPPSFLPPELRNPPATEPPPRVAEAVPLPETVSPPLRKRRPNLGQSRRLGLGAPLANPELVHPEAPPPVVEGPVETPQEPPPPPAAPARVTAEPEPAGHDTSNDDDPAPPAQPTAAAPALVPPATAKAPTVSPQATTPPAPAGRPAPPTGKPSAPVAPVYRATAELRPAPRRERPQATVVDRVPAALAAEVRSRQRADVSDVPVYRGPRVSEAAKSKGARAFAANGAVFLPDEAGPVESSRVRGLLAHELVHAVQQRTLGSHLPAPDSPLGQRLEAEAQAAERYYSGESGAVEPAPLIHAPLPPPAPTAEPDLRAAAQLAVSELTPMPQPVTQPAPQQPLHSPFDPVTTAEVDKIATESAKHVVAEWTNPALHGNTAARSGGQQPARTGTAFNATARRDQLVAAALATHNRNLAPGALPVTQLSAAELRAIDGQVATEATHQGQETPRYEANSAQAWMHAVTGMNTQYGFGHTGHREPVGSANSWWGSETEDERPFRERFADQMGLINSDTATQFDTDTWWQADEDEQNGDQPAQGGRGNGSGSSGHHESRESTVDVSRLDLDELATRIYDRLRSRLRTELLVDRERAGLLTDFR